MNKNYTNFDVALKLAKMVDVGRIFLRSKKPNQKLVNIEKLGVQKVILLKKERLYD